MKSLAPIQTVDTARPYQFTTSINQAAYYVAGVVHDPVDYQNMFNNPLLTSATNATNIWLERNTVRNDLTNNTNATVRLECYECMARRDIPQSFGGVIATLNNGFTTNNISQTEVSASPFQSRDFCSFYRILSVKKFLMLPGQTVQHMMRGKPRKINHIYSSTYYNAFGMYTKFFLYKVVGQICNDQTSQGNVGISGNKIDCVVREQIHYRFMNPIVSGHVYGNTLAAVTTPAFINPLTGSATTYIST